MAMCMPSGSFMGYGNWEEILHRKAIEEEYVCGNLSTTPAAESQKAYNFCTKDDIEIAELQDKIEQIEKDESVSEYYIESMRGALAGIKNGDANSAMRFLIAALLEPKEDRPG